MAKMRAVQVTKPKGPFELTRTSPGPGCGISRSTTTGHEIAGVVNALVPSRRGLRHEPRAKSARINPAPWTCGCLADQSEAKRAFAVSKYYCLKERTEVF